MLSGAGAIRYQNHVNKNPLKCQSLFSTLPETNIASENRQGQNELISNHSFSGASELLVDIRLKQALIFDDLCQPEVLGHLWQNIKTSCDTMFVTGNDCKGTCQPKELRIHT